MTPRETDALVAEHVMGWKRGNVERGQYPWKSPEGEALMPHPWSTSIACAWQVVEKMRADHQMRCFITIHPDGLTEVQFREGIHDKGLGVSHATPEAICLAALRTVGVAI